MYITPNLPNESPGSNQRKNTRYLLPPPTSLFIPLSNPPNPSNRTRLLQQPRQVSPSGLQIRIATNMRLLDEDIGHGALIGDLLEGILYGGAVGHLIQLYEEVVGAKLAEEGLGRPAVGAVGFGEDHHAMIGDDALGLFHGGGGRHVGCGVGAEETTE